MRKAQKKQIEHLTELLSQAHLKIRNVIEDKNFAVALELLYQCQECAVELGEFIEETEKDRVAVIPFLEDYCETVYCFYEEISEGRGINAGKIYKKLQESLLKIEDSLKNDIRTKYEMVFMPYKASMWDSLESVWQAAVEDEDCDVYVVPIPYYDRKADTSLGQFHYEGEDFPDYVEVTDYRTYDFVQRQPDVIYIHNPYDEGNYVTSVAPQFYSSKLREYTACLVYIPYCVYAEPDMPDREETIEFCSRYVTPGLIMADRVILQSENFWRAVVNALLKCGQDREFWEEKIIALGSPKYDKMRITNPDWKQIPKEWKEKITKPDGSRKKVIFYNTSLNALLQYDEQMNRKIRSVLQLFYEKRDECTLLWRPHPLVKATIESMRPTLWAEYKETVDEYRESGWGIYDDTPDFHAAINVSDAYYGDFSSLALLYQATGKPLLLQNTDVLEYRQRLVTSRFYYDGQYVWCTAWEFNGLFRMNPVNYQISYMGQFPKEKPEGHELFYGIAECKEKLYFCPYNAKHIAVYDKVSERFHTIALKESIRDINRKFASILADGKNIYLQGSRAYTIIRLNTETEEVFYIENWVKELQERQTRKFDYLLQRDGCVHEGSLYYFCPGACGMLRILLDSCDYEFISLQCGEKDGFTELISADGLLWLTPSTKGSITCFNPRTAVLTKLIPIEGAIDSCRLNAYIYYFSFTEPYFYRIDIKSKEVTRFFIGEGIYCACAAGDKILMTTYLTGKLYVFDTATLEITKTTLAAEEIGIPKLNVVKMLEENQKYNQYATESGFVNLEKLTGLDIRNCNRKQGKEVDCCGKEIHKYVKGLMG